MTGENGFQTYGIGPTATLSLRVSVAALARVVFPHPVNGEPMLALEHKATLLADEVEPQVLVKAQPFGGAIRIRNFANMNAIVENFRYDSERSRSEQDFRIFIKPSDWPAVRDFCLRSFSRADGSELESDPTRELVEEFEDAMGIDLKPDQYVVKAIRTVLENEPARTENVHAAGISTVRIYRVFEANIVHAALSRAMMANSENHSSDFLRSLALEDASNRGRGRANAILAVSMQRIRDAYLDISPYRRSEPLYFENTRLDGNVPAVLEGIHVPKYQNVED
ncbi:MAG: hypothetical protein WA996_22360 [Candidatus Promineifilaceae bacterium]